QFAAELVARSEAAETVLRRQIGELALVAGQAQERVLAMGDSLRSRTEDLGAAGVRAGELTALLGAETQNLSVALERVSARAEASGDGVRRNSQELGGL